MSTPDLRIAISSIPRPIETGYGPDNAGTVADRAVAAIARSGAAPIVLPVTDPRLAPAQLDGVDGLFDVRKAGNIARLGYLDFSSTEEIFSMRRPKWKDDSKV